MKTHTAAACLTNQVGCFSISVWNKHVTNLELTCSELGTNLEAGGERLFVIAIAIAVAVSVQICYNISAEGGTTEMCELVEEYAEKKTIRKKMEIAKNLINTTNLTLEDIARCVELPVATVEELAHGRTA